MEDVLTWIEETLALRHAAMLAKMTEPEYDNFEYVLEEYSERVDPDAADHQLHNRDEDDAEDLSWWEDEVVDLAPKILFALLHLGENRYTAITSTDKNYDEGRLPAWDYHIERIEGEWRIIGQTSPYAGRDHGSHTVVAVRYFNEDALRSEVASFVGSITIG